MLHTGELHSALGQDNELPQALQAVAAHALAFDRNSAIRAFTSRLQANGCGLARGNRIVPHSRSCTLDSAACAASDRRRSSCRGVVVSKADTIRGGLSVEAEGGNSVVTLPPMGPGGPRRELRRGFRRLRREISATMHIVSHLHTMAWLFDDADAKCHARAAHVFFMHALRSSIRAVDDNAINPRSTLGPPVCRVGPDARR